MLCWLKTPGDVAARQKIVETSRTFESIPGVVSVTCGRALPSTRPVVDSSYDVAIMITFADEGALHAYDGHPTHKQAVDEVLKPLVGKFLIYDFKAE
ncbi:MAG: Dabb family protein [Planctomycetota bacterium]|nr:Dabb family protein [Planctomycetota bacterium]